MALELLVFRDQFANLQSLPFVASFNATNMVAGQNIYISTDALTIVAAPIYTPASTVTLIPQTIDGAVTAVNTIGNFTEYTVALAAYDLFPDLAVQAGQIRKKESVTEHLPKGVLAHRRQKAVTGLDEPTRKAA